mmetsp:Transcript_16769/g.37217  ORF Transcript_16769/g.37217 Transcript_16769/m.37217 type:complete len:193 (+) Transcript_16769:283-861(+)
MLPALALPRLTVVVSPLVALMNDQMRKLPVQLPGACLSGALSAQQVMATSDAVLRGLVKVLFVSPERLCTPSFRRLLTLLQQQTDYQYNGGSSSVSGGGRRAVSLLCVDEAHCLSQWSFNFRPAFLRILPSGRSCSPAHPTRRSAGPDRHRHCAYSQRHSGAPGNYPRGSAVFAGGEVQSAGDGPPGGGRGA